MKIWITWVPETWTTWWFCPRIATLWLANLITVFSHPYHQPINLSVPNSPNYTSCNNYSPNSSSPSSTPPAALSSAWSHSISPQSILSAHLIVHSSPCSIHSPRTIMILENRLLSSKISTRKKIISPSTMLSCRLMACKRMSSPLLSNACLCMFLNNGTCCPAWWKINALGLILFRLLRDMSLCSWLMVLKTLWITKTLP